MLILFLQQRALRHSLHTNRLHLDLQHLPRDVPKMRDRYLRASGASQDRTPKHLLPAVVLQLLPATTLELVGYGVTTDTADSLDVQRWMHGARPRE